MTYITTSVDIDTEDILSEIDTDDLIKELEDRRGAEYNIFGVDGDEARSMLTGIWLKKRIGQDYSGELDSFLYYVLGKVI
jgi:hypothetical protein